MLNKHYTLAQNSKLFTLIFTFFAGFSALIAQPVNDNLCDATELTVGDFCTTVTNGDLAGATTEMNESMGACFGFAPTLNTVWYSFTAPASGLVMLSANFPDIGTAIDLKMAVYEINGADCVLDSLVEIACNDSEVATGSAERLPSIGMELTPGNTYYVQVAEQFFLGEDPTNLGTFCVQVEELQTPSNDEICDAIALEMDADPIVFSNIGATSNFEFGLAPPPNPSDITGVSSWGLNFTVNRSIWFSFVAPESGVVDLDLSGLDVIGNYSSKIAVFEADDCTLVDGTNRIAAQASFFDIFPPNYSGGGIFGLSRIKELPCLTPGQTYFVLVDGTPDFFFQPTLPLGRGLIAVRSVTLDPMGFEETVMDAGCTGEARGTIILEGIGGASGRYANNGNSTSPQYTYEWSTGETTSAIDSLTAGNYEVTLTDVCGETFVKSYEIIENIAPSVLISDDETVMAGDEVALFAYGQNGNPFDTPRMYMTSNNGFGAPSGRVMQYNLRSEEQPITIAGDTLPRFSNITYADDKFYTLESRFDPVLQTSFYTIQEGDFATSIINPIGDFYFANLVRYTDIQYNLYTNELWAMTTEGDMDVIDLATGTATNVFNVGVDFPTQFVIVDEEYIIVSTEDSQNDRQAILSLIELATLEVETSASIPAQPLRFDLAIDPGTPDVYFLSRRGPASVTYREYWHFNLATGESTSVRTHPDGFPELTDFTIAPRTVEGYDYVWTPAADLDDSMIPEPVATVNATTNYEVQITDGCGVTATNSVTLSVGGNEADLELNITSSLTEYHIWEIVPYQITLTNNGTADATNVKVAAGLPSGMVYTSHNVVTGNYNDYNLFYEEWTVPSLAAGETATLDLVLFPLVQNTDLTNFVQVLESDQIDPDSTPGNDTDNTPDEDDEAAMTLSNANLIAPLVANSGTGIGNAVLYPTPATDVLHVAFESGTTQPQMMQIYDVLGRVVLEQNVDIYEGFNQVYFEISDLKSGTYFVWMGAEAKLMKFVK